MIWTQINEMGVVYQSIRHRISIEEKITISDITTKLCTFRISKGECVKGDDNAV